MIAPSVKNNMAAHGARTNRCQLNIRYGAVFINEEKALNFARFCAVTLFALRFYL